MFKNKPNLTKAIESEQHKLLSEMEGMDVQSPEYSQHLDALNKLDTVKPKANRVSYDALVSAGASLAGIILVINYERVGSIISKSYSLVRKA